MLGRLNEPLMMRGERSRRTEMMSSLTFEVQLACTENQVYRFYPVPARATHASYVVQRAMHQSY